MARRAPSAAGSRRRRNSRPLGLTELLDTSFLAAPDVDGYLFEADWHASIITIGELEAGVLVTSDNAVRAQRLRRLSGILATVEPLPVDHAVAVRYGELRAASGRGPSNDLWIAATAMAHDLLLVTRDQGQAALPLVRTRLLPSA